MLQAPVGKEVTVSQSMQAGCLMPRASAGSELFRIKCISLEPPWVLSPLTLGMFEEVLQAVQFKGSPLEKVDTLIENVHFASLFAVFQVFQQ